MSAPAEAALPSPKTVRLQGAGADLVADCWGDDATPPVLLLHGGGQTRAAWTQTAQHLARHGWRAIAPDLRGHVDSDWPEDGAYDTEDFARDITEIVNRMVSPPAIVGASLGGMVALTAQRLSTEQLFSAIVLVDITPRMEPEGVARIVGFMLGHPDGFSSLEEASDAIAAYRPGRPRPKDLSGLERTLRRTSDGRWHWRWDVRFLTSKFRATDSGIETLESRRALVEGLLLRGAQKLRVPTLLVRGAESDIVGGEGVSAFLEAVPHAEFVDVKDAGHMVAGDQNDAFSAAVVQFLRNAAGVSIAQT
ncbi:MAG: alpha/beta fold hydrolase [Deltaproteobacteria bacterium]|nr:alpha/beta fold hydrolase [Deltaproteobacteria bacterium]